MTGNCEMSEQLYHSHTTSK